MIVKNLQINLKKIPVKDLENTPSSKLSQQEWDNGIFITLVPKVFNNLFLFVDFRGLLMNFDEIS